MYKNLFKIITVAIFTLISAEQLQSIQDAWDLAPCNPDEALVARRRIAQPAIPEFEQLARLPQEEFDKVPYSISKQMAQIKRAFEELIINEVLAAKALSQADFEQFPAGIKKDLANRLREFEHTLEISWAQAIPTDGLIENVCLMLNIRPDGTFPAAAMAQLTTAANAYCCALWKKITGHENVAHTYACKYFEEKLKLGPLATIYSLIYLKRCVEKATVRSMANSDIASQNYTFLCICSLADITLHDQTWSTEDICKPFGCNIQRFNRDILTILEILDYRIALSQHEIHDFVFGEFKPFWDAAAQSAAASS